MIMTDSQGKIPQFGNSKNYGTLEICRRYIGIFFLAAQIHFKGVKLAPENPAISQFCVISYNS